MKYRDYEDNLLETMWTWADIHATGQLVGEKRPQCSPVFAKDFADHNVITPNDAEIARSTTELIPSRHPKFANMKSSQALAQSVFGGLIVAGRLDLLERITADCGYPAFGMPLAEAEAELEFKVDWLGEPTPTRVDALLKSPTYRVAVECKFTEKDFGRGCSRPKKSSFDERHCDGSYTRQLGRVSRCSLTEYGVAYWDHVPQLFHWSASTYHAPCPIRRNYQLVRNTIAACSMLGQAADPSTGHVLVVYDQRNPKFTQGGAAHTHFVATSNAAIDKGLLRKVPWQTLAEAISREPEFDWLVRGLRDRYGITPVDEIRGIVTTH